MHNGDCVICRARLLLESGPRFLIGHHVQKYVKAMSYIRHSIDGFNLIVSNDAIHQLEYDHD